MGERVLYMIRYPLNGAYTTHKHYCPKRPPWPTTGNRGWLPHHSRAQDTLARGKSFCLSLLGVSNWCNFLIKGQLAAQQSGHQKTSAPDGKERKQNDKEWLAFDNQGGKNDPKTGLFTPFHSFLLWPQKVQSRPKNCLSSLPPLPHPEFPNERTALINWRAQDLGKMAFEWIWYGLLVVLFCRNAGTSFSYHSRIGLMFGRH